MTESILVHDLAFYLRDDVPADIAWWAAAEPDNPISIVIDPAGPVDEVTKERVARIMDRLPRILTDARGWLANRLGDAEFGLDADEREKLSADSFEDPEIIVWNGHEWMIRFEAPGIAMADPWGVGMRFEGDDAVEVEDLSDVDDDEH